MKILLLTAPMPAGYFDAALRAADPSLDFVEYHDGLGDAELAGFEVALAWRFPPGVVARLTNLKWVCAVSAGVDKLLVPELGPTVAVSRMVDPEQAEGIAQFVVLMALRQARGLARYERQQAERAWRRQPVSVVRSRVGVLGAGATGSAIARLMGQVGFQARSAGRRDPAAFDEVLTQSEFVVCAVPLTAETRGFLHAGVFARMRPGAYFINIARGEQVVEADLIEAVRSGQLAGAALDVQQHEPMPADDPLWDVPGITITPHIAGQSTPETIAGQFVAGLRCLQRGEPLPNRVDRERGY